MNSNQEIKNLVRSIKLARWSNGNKRWHIFGVNKHIKFTIPVGIPFYKKESKFKKFLLSLFSVFNLHFKTKSK
jgi:hypothetical protein